VASAEGLSRYSGFETWYRVTGDLESGKVPLIVAHGGPGLTHDYLATFGELSAGGRAVIHYDQIGNGNSTHLPKKGPEFWTVDFFLGELEALIRHLGIGERYALLGHCWGGMLCAEHAVRRPAGLKALVLANSLAAMDLWVAGTEALRAELPQAVRDILDQHEAAGTTGGPDYLAATVEFCTRHFCRVPFPPELVRIFAWMGRDSTVFRSMYGPTEFRVTGTLRGWSIIGRLGRIDVPTLAYRGAYDRATPECVQPFFERIPDVEGWVFLNSSHMPHIEEKETCLQVVESFLERHDGHGG
jgi:L-proline amide hydrolase